MNQDDVLHRLVRRLLPQAIRKSIWEMRQDPARWWLGWRYEWLYRGGYVRRGPFHFRLHRHEEVSRAIYVDGNYGPGVLKLLLQTAPHFHSFIDCGANIGAISVPMGAHSGLPALAVEPAPVNASLLDANLQVNALSSRVKLVTVALGETRGRMPIYLCESNQGDVRLWREGTSNRQSMEVDLMPLDDVVAMNPSIRPPFLVKIDVQGYEYNVLRGARAVLAAPILILAEFWPEGLRGAGCSVEAYEALIAESKLTVYEVATNRLQGLRPVRSLESLAKRFIGENFCDLVMTNRTLEEVGLSHLLVNEDSSF